MHQTLQNLLYQRFQNPWKLFRIHSSAMVIQQIKHEQPENRNSFMMIYQIAEFTIDWLTEPEFTSIIEVSNQKIKFSPQQIQLNIFDAAKGCKFSQFRTSQQIKIKVYITSLWPPYILKAKKCTFQPRKICIKSAHIETTYKDLLDSSIAPHIMPHWCTPPL